MLGGTGTNFGRMVLERYDGTNQIFSSAGSAISLAAGNIVDCYLTRSAWTITATASNRANSQVSTSSYTSPGGPNLATPVISEACCYSLGGSVYVDDISYTINHRKPARFLVIGGSGSEGYNATTVPKRYVNVIQSNFVEVVCNDSSAYNTTSNSVSALPEILAHQPGTALLLIGGNDLQFGFPTNQWQSAYSNLVAQLQLHGTRVKHLLPSPRNVVDLRPLTNFIISHYPAGDIIDTWSPLLTNAYSLKPIYDAGDGVHPNDAGHLLMGLIVRTNLH
jgi:lysophospholipase L1-like esterase